MKNINFAIREIGELYNLEFLISEFQKNNIFWNVHTVPYNSDLKLFSVPKRLEKYSNVHVTDGSKGIGKKCLGFKTDISGKFEDKVNSCIDVYRVATCMNLDFGIDVSKIDKYDIVVSNVKINDKKPDKEYSPKMWEILGKLPYNIAVVPRHPFPEDHLNGVNIPDNITIINKVGVLKGLCARTSLTVMGLIFSNTEGEMDHSPLEATLNSNAISGMYGQTEEAYIDYYKNSGLIHQYRDFEDSIEDIPSLIGDKTLWNKLENKKNWIKNNRSIYLPQILDTLLSN